MEEKYLQINNLKKIYPNGFQAIFDLNLKISKGEFIVFVGPSGCGKSTTIRMIAGLESVSNGEIYVSGKNWTDIPARKRNISMVFQNYALFPHLTVKENIAFTLKSRFFPREEIEKKVKWAAKALKLSYVLNRKPAQLSGGQRQRVALGRAIVAEPTLFLMDEPLSNLDAKLRGLMRNTIKKLHNDINATSIYVTHDQIEAMTMGDRIVVMSDGFIQQVGRPDEVFEHPANRFVAEFIGTPIMNILKGKFKNKKFNTSFGTIDVSKKILRKSESKTYELGFRPRYCLISKTKKLNTLKNSVIDIEILGAETIVHTIEGLKIVVSTENKPKVGETIYVKPDLDKIHLFDAKSGLSLTSPINETTMSSLKIFYQSEALIANRTALMEKQKNKKIHEGWTSRIVSTINTHMYPEYILLNPKYSQYKKNIREQKLLLEDARRRKQIEEIQETNSQLKKYQEDLKKITSELRKYQKNIFKFNSNYKKLQKMHSNLLIAKAKKQILDSIKSLKLDSEAIKHKYDKEFIYDYEKLIQFNNNFEIITKKNR